MYIKQYHIYIYVYTTNNCIYCRNIHYSRYINYYYMLMYIETTIYNIIIKCVISIKYILILISFRTVYQVFATVGEQVFFAVDAIAVGDPVLVLVMVVVAVLVRLVRRYLPRVHVQAVLALFRKTDQKSDEIVHDRVRYVLGQPFLLHAVLVQRGHEICQRLRHSELDFQLPAGEHQWILCREDDAITQQENVFA